MSLVNPETGEVVVLLTADEAKALTAKIKGYTAALWRLLKQAHDGQAWRAMGYSSWRAYIDAEFDLGKSHAYRLLRHAEVVYALDEAAGLDHEVSPMGDTLAERVTRDLNTDEAAAAIRDAVADLPEDAHEERAEAATETVRQLTERTKTAATTSGSDGADTGGGNPPPSPASGAPQLREVPTTDDGPAVGDLVDWHPIPGQWSTYRPFHTSDLARAFALTMDRRLPRESDEDIAGLCPAEMRRCAAFAARQAAAYWTALADDLSRPTHLAAVEDR